MVMVRVGVRDRDRDRDRDRKEEEVHNTDCFYTLHRSKVKSKGEGYINASKLLAKKCT